MAQYARGATTNTKQRKRNDDNGQPTGASAMAILEGTLSKWTNVMKGWQYRWFVLDENAGLLSYYTVSVSACELAVVGWGAVGWEQVDAYLAHTHTTVST